MEDLLIAACKTPLKVGLLSSAHRGRRTETERRRRSAGALFRLCHGYVLKRRNCLIARSCVNRAKVQASSCLLCVATGQHCVCNICGSATPMATFKQTHTCSSVTGELLEFICSSVIVQRPVSRHFGNIFGRAWVLHWATLCLVVAVVTFLTAQLLRLHSQLPQLLCKSLIQS